MTATLTANAIVCPGFGAGEAIGRCRCGPAAQHPPPPPLPLLRGRHRQPWRPLSRHRWTADCRARPSVYASSAAGASAAGDTGGVSRGGPGSSSAAGAAPPGSGLRSFLHPFSDPACNRKLLALSAAQMLSSIATVLHDTYIPLYMTERLHMSNTQLGNLHGLLQFLARASGVVSGRLADVLSPARMVVLGTALTAILCKPAFAVCGSVHKVFSPLTCATWIKYAKVADRLAKALVAELAAQSGDSAAGAFGVRHALATLGVVLGSAAAVLAFQATGRNYEATFAVSTVPALLALALVATALRSDERQPRSDQHGGGGRSSNSGSSSHSDGGGGTNALAGSYGDISRLGSLGSGIGSAAGSSSARTEMSLMERLRAVSQALPPGYWQALATACILYLARFDIAFITVHASSVMSKAGLPLLTLCSTAPVVLLAPPMGMAAKRGVRARNCVLLAGMAALVAADLGFALTRSASGMVLASTLVGVHLAMTQGGVFAMLASYIPSRPIPGLGRISATVWSLTDLMLGVALACANSQAGRLSDWTAARNLGTAGCFYGGAAASLAAMLALLGFVTCGDLGREPARWDGAGSSQR